MEARNLKIRRETLADKVEQQMRELLTDGTWQVGERLPTEAELAKMFGVSRLTVRMSIQKLSASGLVVTRAGEGTFVQAFSLQNYLSAASNFYVTADMLNDVCEFRRLLELECARLACQRATPEDLAAMQKACDEYLRILREGGELNEENLQRRVKADLDFHYAICQASHNSMYVLAFCAARSAISQHLKIIIPRRILGNPHLDYVSDGRTVHQYILDTIQAGDAAACKKAYQPHIDHNIRLSRLEKSLSALTPPRRGDPLSAMREGVRIP